MSLSIVGPSLDGEPNQTIGNAEAMKRLAGYVTYGWPVACMQLNAGGFVVLLFGPVHLLIHMNMAAFPPIRRDSGLPREDHRNCWKPDRGLGLASHRLVVV
ncbi:uncharacterized protein BBA_09005 [Beauveria bassiana ARSEF 2860]|uniref:Uncharacterized protein n=1 Tax=Beauveria bassiana (strain ARSEF 2860) TaxID=655819 RepID=J5JEC8_BEAB2|nr:uncharacterized protein BBA_09005 [Beauveria bassiana ARSEF 2860]EJP62081.1 hypothetical protein BBA_09005 [Beauveria bassiana ARSEF 2860]